MSETVTHPTARRGLRGREGFAAGSRPVRGRLCVRGVLIPLSTQLGGGPA